MPVNTALLRVLVVEDHLDAAETLRILLTHWGYHVRIARDGKMALEEVSAFHPDVILLDIGVPKINGYEVARKVRAMSGMEHLLLIATTGYGRDEDRRRSAEVGIDYHLVKPYEPDVLKQILAGPSENGKKRSSN